MPIFFSPNDYQKNKEIHISTLKTDMAKENVSLKFKF